MDEENQMNIFNELPFNNKCSSDYKICEGCNQKCSVKEKCPNRCKPCHLCNKICNINKQCSNCIKTICTNCKKPYENNRAEVNGIFTRFCTNCFYKKCENIECNNIVFPKHDFCQKCEIRYEIPETRCRGYTEECEITKKIYQTSCYFCQKKDPNFICPNFDAFKNQNDFRCQIYKESQYDYCKACSICICKWPLHTKTEFLINSVEKGKTKNFALVNTKQKEKIDEIYNIFCFGCIKKYKIKS